MEMEGLVVCGGVVLAYRSRRGVGLVDGLVNGLADGLAEGLADGLADGLANGLADGAVTEPVAARSDWTVVERTKGHAIRRVDCASTADATKILNKTDQNMITCVCVCVCERVCVSHHTV